MHEHDWSGTDIERRTSLYLGCQILHHRGVRAAKSSSRGRRRIPPASSPTVMLTHSKVKPRLKLLTRLTKEVPSSWAQQCNAARSVVPRSLAYPAEHSWITRCAAACSTLSALDPGAVGGPAKDATAAWMLAGYANAKMKISIAKTPAFSCWHQMIRFNLSVRDPPCCMPRRLFRCGRSSGLENIQVGLYRNHLSNPHPPVWSCLLYRADRR